MTSVLRYVWYAAAVIAPTLAVTELAAQSRAIPAIRLPPGVLATRAPTATTTQTDYPTPTPPPAPRVTVSLSGAATVTEGESLRFRITASRPPEVSLPFAYTLSGDTAALQRPATTGRVTLNQGQSSAEIVLPTRDDAAVNGRRRIALTLIQAPTRVTSANVYRAAGIVLDNDAATASPTPTPTPTPPPPTVLPVVTLGNAAQVVEGGVLRFPVRLDAPAREPVSVALAITDPRRAAGGTRTAGLRIAEGARSGLLSLAAADDSQVNGARVVSVQLLRALGARLGSPGSARGQVTDNDVAPSASAAPTDQPSTMAPTATPAESASPAASASAIETASVATAVPSTEAQPTADNAAFVDPGGGGTGNGAPPAAPSEPGRGWPIWQLVLAVLAGLAALVAAATAAARALLRVTCTTQTGALAAPLSDLTLSSPEVKISAQVTPGEVITGEMSGFAAGRANRDGEQQ
jgi:hypothetical protein